MAAKHVLEPADEPRPAADIRIVSGDPTTEEVAAVTAVLAVALEQLASQHRRRDTGSTAWERSQRSMRGLVVRGRWHDFTR
jgi:hypothetical protein